jgi:ATP synthase protein I
MTTAIAVIIAWTWSGSAAATASLFGGLVAIVPALYLLFRINLRRNVVQAKEVLGTIYQGELIKLLLTALMFFIGALLFGKHFAPLIVTCMACLAMNWVILAVTRFD